MGRLSLILALLLWFPGCVAVTAVAAIPSALVEGLFSVFTSKEESLPISTQAALVSVQTGLRSMKLDVDVLEPVDEGYTLVFGSEKLDGTISLERQTPKLTTIYVKVRSGVTREESVERAILEAIRQTSKGVSDDQRFQFKGYSHVYKKPTIESKQLGWYRPGANLRTVNSGNDWLRLKMPSGKTAYLKGNRPNRAQGK